MAAAMNGYLEVTEINQVGGRLRMGQESGSGLGGQEKSRGCPVGQGEADLETTITTTHLRSLAHLL